MFKNKWKKVRIVEKWIDRTGQRYGKLVCREYLGNGKWKCICDCGNEHIVSTSGLTTGKTKSCDV